MWLRIRYFPFLYSSQYWSFSSAAFKSSAYTSHEPMFLLLQRVVKIFFSHFYSQLVCGIFSRECPWLWSCLSNPISFFLGNFERTCFSSLTYSNRKNISFAFIWTFSLFLFQITEYWSEFALVMVFLHVHYCIKQWFWSMCLTSSICIA